MPQNPMSHKREMPNQKAYNARKENTLELLRQLSQKKKEQTGLVEPQMQGMHGIPPQAMQEMSPQGMPPMDPYAQPEMPMPEERDLLESPPIPRYWLKVAQNKVKELGLPKDDWRMQALKRFEQRFNDLEAIEQQLYGMEPAKK